MKKYTVKKGFLVLHITLFLNKKQKNPNLS